MIAGTMRYSLIESTTAAITSTNITGSGLSVPEIVVYSVLAGTLVAVTVLGNLLVLASLILERQLRSISNYFLLSLAVADLMIGLVSMPLYTAFLIVGYWPLPYYVCDLWLSIDYTMSNASVANLLIISIDRYCTITQPLTYRVKRTFRRAVIMITTGWLVSALMWTPLIYIWPLIDGKRKVPPTECYIQFIESNSLLTLLTACLAYFIPVTIISVLYLRIYRETNLRRRMLNAKVPPMLNIHNTTIINTTASSSFHHSSSDSRHSSFKKCNVSYAAAAAVAAKSNLFNNILKRLNSSLKSINQEEENDQRPNSILRNSKSLSIKTEKSNSRQRSFRDSYHTINNTSTSNRSNILQTQQSDEHQSLSEHKLRYSKSQSLDSNASFPEPISSARDDCITSVYTCFTAPELPEAGCYENSFIVPDEVRVRPNRVDSPLHQLSIKHSASFTAPTIASAEIETNGTRCRHKNSANEEESTGVEDRLMVFSNTNARERNCSPPKVQTTAAAAAAAAATKPTLAATSKTAPVQSSGVKFGNGNQTSAGIPCRHGGSTAQKLENKAAKTLSAILLAFIITWTPYNIFTVINAFYSNKNKPIGRTIYSMGYWLCYLNSTVNPVLYAFCNPLFRRTFIAILTCSISRGGISQRNKYRYEAG